MSKVMFGKTIWDRGFQPKEGMTDWTDENLLQCFIREQDDDAFAVLLRRHGPMVLSVCRRLLGDAHEAEDALQATFLVMARKADSISRPHLLSNWLYGVAYRTAMKARTVSAKRRNREQTVPNLPEIPATAEETWDDVPEMLDEEVNRLPEKYRVLVVLCYFQGWTNEQAARKMGCPKGTVLSRLAWARDRLRARLTRRGVTVSAGLLVSGLVPSQAFTLSASQIDSLTQAAKFLTTGQALAAGIVSNHVANLTQGVLRMYFLTKVKVILSVLVMLGLITMGSLWFAYGATDNSNKQAPAAKKVDPATELKRLQGTWLLIEAQDNGRKALKKEIEGAKATLALKGKRMTLVLPGETVETTFTIDPNQDPKWIDFHFPNKNRTDMGLYRLKDDVLEIVIDEGNTAGKRPTAFRSEGGNSPNDLLMKFKRAKK